MDIKTGDIEACVACRFRPFNNTVIPNVAFSLFNSHESDLIVLTPAGYGYEVEIKISKSDLLADKKKQRWKPPYNKNGGYPPKLIKWMWFAGPVELEDALIEHAPPFAGILVVERRDQGRYWILKCREVRKPKKNPFCRKWTDEERHKLNRLAYLRFIGSKKYSNKIITEKHDSVREETGVISTIQLYGEEER